MSRADPEHLDRLIRQYAEGEKGAYDSAAALQDHTDKMLTWLLGLMGAGLIAGMPLLKNTPAAGRFCPVRALARGNRRRARRPHHSRRAAQQRKPMALRLGCEDSKPAPQGPGGGHY